MNFSTDRDLLAHEPQLFNEIAWLSQQRVLRTDAGVTGDTLTCPSADFAASSVAAGSVVMINGVAHEVIERLNSTTLRISMLRSRATDDVIAPEPVTLGEATVRTFAPQATLMHDALLRMLGLAVDTGEGTLGEDAVVSLGAMARLEALGTLERLYGSAATLDAANAHFSSKQQHYRRAFAEALRNASILIDTNSDGLAEEKRTPGIIQWNRA